MSFTPLVDAWHDSEETRSRLRPGRRWYRMEKELGDGTYLADMTPNRHHWRHREVLDPEPSPERVWRYYPAPDRAAETADEGAADEVADTDVVDGFVAEFPDPTEPDLTEPDQDAAHRVGRARDTVRHVCRTGDALAHDATGDDPASGARREQLARWHDDDSATDTESEAASADGDADVAADGVGWSQ